MSAPEYVWADAARRWSEAAALLRTAGRAPARLGEWLGPGWTGAAADGFGAWGRAFERATHRAASALEDAAVRAGDLAAGAAGTAGAAGATGAAGTARTAGAAGAAGGGELGSSRLDRLDVGARAVLAVPVPGERASRRRPERSRAPSAGASPARDGVRGWIDEAVGILRAHGYRPDQTDPEAIATIIRHESSGDPSAVNRWDANAARGTPSMGLMQTTGPTFERWHLPGHDRVLDPVDNIIAGVRYAVARYGSVSEVPGMHSLQAGHGYRPY